ncbi:MAG: UDP-N-acetylmuramoyl-tripeptide--D-alanyl-D-alanine ligase [Bdellovibrionales bacterium]|nr:UDP-N-acetylmuramoyl-tripeptide--D-alanyl-D-alanine ligase [Bdellovibrionales bacterium]
MASQQKFKTRNWPIKLPEVLSAVHGQCSYPIHHEFWGVATDSRVSLQNQLFVALVGDRFDAHEFLDQALERGARGLLVQKSEMEKEEKTLSLSADQLQKSKFFFRSPEYKNKIRELEQRTTVIQVDDTLKALQDLANFWRKQQDYTLVGVTGSNGKTTTKEFATLILNDYKKCFSSPGSFNNHWGVPLTLLRVPEQTEIVVQEMGMNHLGEIARLCHVAQPDIVLVTMVGQSHIGEVGSQKAIAQAKEEIYLNCPQAKQVFNLDNEWTRAMYQRAQKHLAREQLLTFSGFTSAVDVHMRVEEMPHYQLKIQGHIGGVPGQALVPVFGRHNLVNLMAASALAFGLGMPPQKIWLSLPKCRGSWGRNQLMQLPQGTQLLFDGYNANPESMSALMRNLLELEVKGKKVVVLGQMLELGEKSAQAHFDLGVLVAQTFGVEIVVFMGSDSSHFLSGLKKENFSKTYFVLEHYDENVIEKVKNLLHPTDFVVIKGSRGMKMEKVLQAWKAQDLATVDN